MKTLKVRDSMPVIVHGDHAQIGPVQVQVWPPSIKPWCFAGKVLMEQILQAKPGDPLRALLGNYPLRDDPDASTMSWRLPYIVAANESRVLELWKRNKALVVCIDAEIDHGPNMPELLKECLAGRDRDILGALGHNNVQGLVAALSRTTRDVWTSKMVRKLLHLYASGGWRKRMIHYLPRITSDALMTLSRPTGRVSAKQCLEAAQSQPNSRTVSSALQMLDAYLDPTLQWTYSNLTSEELHTAANRLDLSKRLVREYGYPPVAETSTIRHLPNARRIYSEGKRQRNCLYALHEMIADGSHAAYELRRPRCRCTILIVKQPSGWALAQLKAKENSPPSKQASSEVLNWLSEAYPDIPPESLDLREDDGTEWEEDDVICN